MAEENVADLTLEYLKRFSAQMNSFERTLDRLRDDMQDVKVRVTNLEEGVAGINRRLDRVDGRLDRVERRLELADLPH